MMEPGTIVECIWDFSKQAENVRSMGYNFSGINLKFPKKKGIYTTRKIFRIPETSFIGLLLEEIINPTNILPFPQDGEPGFDVRGFRELLGKDEVNAQSIVQDILNDSPIKEMSHGIY